MLKYKVRATAFVDKDKANIFVFNFAIAAFNKH